MKKMNYHKPVLLNESINGLITDKSGVYVDVTFGGGGHSKGILDKLSDNAKLFSFDQDLDAIKNDFKDPRLVLIHSNFKEIKKYLKFYGIFSVDGILADFGVSSHQFDSERRGFSTRFEAKLDMRMNKKSPFSAFDVINKYSEEKLRLVFYNYGELRAAAGIARVIVENRQQRPIVSSEQLKNSLGRFLPKHRESKILAQIYQLLVCLYF